MNPMGEHLLAGAALTYQQDRDIRWRDFREHGFQSQHAGLVPPTKLLMLSVCPDASTIGVAITFSTLEPIVPHINRTSP